MAVALNRARPRITAEQLYLLSGQVPSGPEADLEPYSFRAPGRKDLPAYDLSFPLDWNIDPFDDRNWCAQLHMWRMLDVHLRQHSQTQDRRWLNFPLAVIRDWHRYHCVDKRPSQYAWMDMMVGLRAMKLAYVMSNTPDDELEADATLHSVFVELVESHLAFLLDPANVAYSNHTFIDLHGTAALAQVVDQATSQDIYRFIEPVLKKLLASQFNEYGVHLENSPGYQPFGIKCVERLQQSGWFGRFQLDRLIAQAQEVCDWLRLPDGRTLPIGDTDGEAQDPSITATAFRGAREVYNCSGYAIVRDDGKGLVRQASLLSLMGAFNSRFHKQADDLSIIWFEGEDILCDAGKFAYKTDPRRGYVQSTRAHNTVEIDGKNYSGDWAGNPKLVYGSAIGAVAVHDWGYLIDAKVRHVSFDATHARFAVYAPGKWLLVIDRLMADAPHEFTQWFHFSPHLPDLTEHDDGFYTTLHNRRSLRVVSVGTTTSTTTLAKGVSRPRLQGWISQAYGALTPNCALGYAQTGKDVIFATLMSIDDRGSKLSLQDNRLTLDLRRADKRESFKFSIGEVSCKVRRELISHSE